jgi:glycosyltransferase involved in cell wall biosynthesis
VAEIARTEKPYLLFVGDRRGYKNFGALLHAYAQHPELSGAYDLIAFGGGAFSDQEQALLRHLGLNDTQVRQMGGGDNVLAALYKGAVLFVYPSLYEGFGIPPL